MNIQRLYGDVYESRVKNEGNPYYPYGQDPKLFVFPQMRCLYLHGIFFEEEELYHSSHIRLIRWTHTSRDIGEHN